MDHSSDARVRGGPVLGAEPATAAPAPASICVRRRFVEPASSPTPGSRSDFKRLRLPEEMRSLDPGRGRGGREKHRPSGAKDSRDSRQVPSLPGTRASRGPEHSPADPCSRCLSPQGGDHLPEGRCQHPGASLARGEHLPDLLRGGPVSEAGAVQEGADALGEERGTRPAPPRALPDGCESCPPSLSCCVEGGAS